MFSLNSLDSGTKNICHQKDSYFQPLVKETKILPMHQQNTGEERNFKLVLIHASVIYQIPSIH